MYTNIDDNVFINVINSLLKQEDIVALRGYNMFLVSLLIMKNTLVLTLKMI
ncbi:hypothetical protein BC30052_2146 [Bacillus cereus]|nr:hypothetical protein BC30052_2146 [Bacillus cereus]